MSKTEVIKVPDIGDFENVPVIEILVEPGDDVNAEQSLITLESDKASMDIPSPAAGRIAEVLVAVGDEVKQGSPIVKLEVAEATDPAGDAEAAPDKGGESPGPEASEQADSADRSESRSKGAAAAGADVEAEVVVLGSGPGGYTAAFRAADLGLKTVLVERYPSLGGVCLNVGCIPSKALLHTAEMITEVSAMADHGVTFGEPEIDREKLLDWKNSVVGKLTQGLSGMAGKRDVKVVQGVGRFTGSHSLEVTTGNDEKVVVGFEKAIIAAGSQAVKLPGLPWDDPRVMDSTDALEVEEIPARLLVIGGGIIGMEMASVYHALGSEITVCELLEQLMPGADQALVKPFHRFVSKRYANIYLGSKVTGAKATNDGIEVTFEGENTPEKEVFDRVLVSVGRSPNGNNIGAEAAGVKVSDKGFIPVDDQMRTNVAHIFAIGDIVGQPMLAHKATHEGKVAAEVCAGQKSGFDARVIPSVAYTDPEVAWVGVTESDARKAGIDYEVGVFPWAASGRALGLGRGEGLTRLLFEKSTERLIGAGIVGLHAGDLIAECALAIEMNSVAADVGLTIHPHPTLSETICFAAEAFEGTITDLYLPKKKAT